ncbi:MAG TPA: lytic transglycosylase domain-containing protein [Acetobacteraceae bacterium]|jgi:soluble lytic murein transglycosylase-like protein|nr:lytic transglycosylase domain-containing protein [Acetobacteraceae bacterium]
MLGLSLRRLPAARAFLASAALLTGVVFDEAHAGVPPGAEDTAMAVPRLALPGGAGVPLPRPLPTAVADRLRRIFSLQRHGDLKAAADASADIDLSLEVGGLELGRAMLGHVLADRYLGRFSKPNANELGAWFAAYADLPDAPAIRSLLIARLPRGASPPPPLPVAEAVGAAEPVPVPEESAPPTIALHRSYGIDRTVWDEARTGKSGAAGRLLARMRSPSRDYVGQLRGEAAQILFTLNRDQEAYDVAAPGANTCGRMPHDGCRDAAIAGYQAGLAAWRMNRPDLAMPMFQAAWRAELTTPALKAAAAFWAARAHLHNGDPAGYVPWMTRASGESNTFYGFLARRALGLDFGAAPGGRGDREILGTADVDAIMSFPAGVRAFALLQIGEPDRAEAELRTLWPEASHRPALGRAIMLVAEEAGLSETAAQLADLVQAADGRPREATRFPIPRIRPDGGFKIDPAMLYGIARAESEFTTSMVSSSGALGVMQVMPETASLVLSTRVSRRSLLGDPEFNLDVGQRYVDYLAKLDATGGDLIRTIASYNAGPGSVAKWASIIRDNDDPLLYLEAIPADETRLYVPRVLTYTWIYARRMHLPMPSLDELAAGAWPHYHPRGRVQEAIARLH